MALFKCQNGTKILTAASVYNIPFSTLYRQVKSGRSDKHLGFNVLFVKNGTMKTLLPT